MENNQTNNTVEERQEKDKQVLIEALKEMPIIQIACKKAGISRATYYRWRKEDKNFIRQGEDALAYGIEFINDMSESQLITLIKEKKMPAINLWLKHSHPRFSDKAKTYTQITAPEDLTPEEQKIGGNALWLASEGTIKINKHGKNKSTIR